MKRPAKKTRISVQPRKPRGMPVPAERVIPNPRKEEERRKGREKVKPEEIEE